MKVKRDSGIGYVCLSESGLRKGNVNVKEKVKVNVKVDMTV